jgi:hypothetical protein
MRVPAASSGSGDDDGGDGDPRAQVFLERAGKAAYDGHYEYAIEMFLSGLSIDPDNLQAHRELREISLKRKAGGGKDLGILKQVALKRWTNDSKQNVLNAEQLLAYDPGNVDHMLSLLQNAHRAELTATAEWAQQLLGRSKAR